MLLPQYCGITILIDVCSNQSNPEEEKDNDDDNIQQQQQQMNTIIRCLNSSSTSLQPASHLGAHHLNHNQNMPLHYGSNLYTSILQTLSIGATNMPTIGSSSADGQSLIGVNYDDEEEEEEEEDEEDEDDDDDDDIPIAILGRRSESNRHFARTDTDNDLDIAEKIQ